MAANPYNQGAQVEHTIFGLGTVMSINEERIVIKFDDHGEKKFVTPMVVGSLKKSDRQPPARNALRDAKRRSPRPWRRSRQTGTISLERQTETSF